MDSINLKSRAVVFARALPVYRTISDRLFDPIRDEDVRFAAFLRVAVRGKNELRAVGREHREPVEAFVERDLFESGSVQVDDRQVKIAFLLIFCKMICAEDDALA